ncbi:RNA polymerase beta chain [Olea europaea subsp. europaea]|uniref:RNA polymerase beta chain (Chloroplast) n=1 Tax=Olea europaea subsp. europaea TaxID=158383 RepID=A0A8S0VA14_OLEEU|nr:RNA polymerase beta chain [Olea europaea subsp. europaea]
MDAELYSYLGTFDARYLMRRLVEVVQHIVIRRTDCGTTWGISVSPRNGMMPERIFIQTLMGRVLADDIYTAHDVLLVEIKTLGLDL